MDRILQTLEAMEGLLTVQRAADLLVHHPQTLYKAIKAGRLPHVRTLGGSVRKHLSDQQENVDEHDRGHAALRPRRTPDEGPVRKGVRAAGTKNDLGAAS